MELCLFDNPKDRFNYLRLDGRVGEDTFGWDRWLNQVLYSSKEWKRFRRQIILRDSKGHDYCCDMGLSGYEITGRVIIHHINPITKDMIVNRDPLIFDPNNVVCVSYETHQAIHYGSNYPNKTDLIERKPNDTCPWLING